MNENHLKLNQRIIQFIPFPRKTKSDNFDTLALSGHCVDFYLSIGLIMDSAINFPSHVSDFGKSCFFHLNSVKAMRYFILRVQFFNPDSCIYHQSI